MVEEILEFDSEREFHSLYCESPDNLKEVERILNVNVVARGNTLTINGDEIQVDKCKDLFSCLEASRKSGFSPQRGDMMRFLKKIAEGKSSEIKELLDKPLVLKIRKRTVVPRNLSQRQFLESILRDDLVFGVGPAGTGKTYIAMIAALHALMEGKIRRIILARPAVEAGEALGFLPGDLEEKLLPYLRPLYDAMDDVLGPVEAKKLVETGVVEIAPLAYMRGRTLSNCFALLDEAQNTTKSQMKMFLTRLGEGSKMVITGDITQIDLPPKQVSGLVDAVESLSKVKGLKFHHFHEEDVVRHPLVSTIIAAYHKQES